MATLLDDSTVNSFKAYHEGNFRYLFGNTYPRFKQLALGNGYNSFVAVDDNDNIWAWKSNVDSRGPGATSGTTGAVEPHIIVPIGKTSSSPVKKIYNGRELIVLYEDGTLYGKGYNTQGQLGLGHTSNVYQLTLIATNVVDLWCPENNGYHIDYTRTFIKKTDGFLYATGYNGYGQLGTGDVITKTSFTKVLLPDADVTKKVWVLDTIYGSTFVETENGKLYCFGYNGYGQLGIGNTTSPSTPFNCTANWGCIPDPNGDIVKDITGAAGYYDTTGYSWTFVMINMFNNIDPTSGDWIYSVKASGNNTYGQCGTGNTTSISIPNVILTDVITDIGVFGGAPATILIATPGNLKGLGYNYYGQLGTGDTATKFTLQEIINSNTYQANKILSKNFNSHTYSYASTSFILNKNNKVFTAGYGPYGQLGINSSTQTNPTWVEVKFPNDVVIDDIKQCAINTGTTFVALDSKGELWTWGYGDTSLININYNQNVAIPIRKIFR